MDYDWNIQNTPKSFAGIVDETIRDGLQNVSLEKVTLYDKQQILQYMTNIDVIKETIIGMSGISYDIDQEIDNLLNGIDIKKLFPWVLTRYILSDLKKAKKYGNRAGANIFCCFSESRMHAEEWSYKVKIKELREAIKFCKDYFPKVRIGIEDATRTTPKTLEAIIHIASELGVDRIAIADTVGVTTTSGVIKIISFIKSIIKDSKISIEWHGHNDRGLAVSNALESIYCGVEYVHGTMMGIGERNGNTAIDTLLFNLPEVFCNAAQIEIIKEYYSYVQKLSPNFYISSYPFLGDNTGKSMTGAHCAAMYKAFKKGETNLAKRLFAWDSNIIKQRSLKDMICLSKYSGRNTIKLLLELNHIEYNNELLELILSHIKKSDNIYDKNSIIKLVKQCE